MYINLNENERTDIICALQAQAEEYDRQIKKGNAEITEVWKQNVDKLIRKIEGAESIWKK